MESRSNRSEIKTTYMSEGGWESIDVLNHMGIAVLESEVYRKVAEILRWEKEQSYLNPLGI